MRKIVYQVYLCILSISGLILYSCDGDETYDIYGDSSNKVYIVNSGMKSFSLLHTLTKSIADINLNFQLCCTQIAKEDLTVSMVVDNSMVDIYNKTYGTSYATVPEDALVFEKKSFTIGTNKQKADDNVRISIKENRLRELREANYLIPVRVKEVSGDAQYATSVNYAVITTSEDLDNWWDGATPEDAHAIEISDRSGWTAEFTNTDAGISGSMDQLFDDDENNYIYRRSVTNVTTELVLNLGKEHNLVGIYLNGHCRSSNTYGIIASISIDGDNWEKVGTVTTANAYDGISMMFYTPMKVKYVKYYFPPSGSDTRVMVYEFRAYTLTK